MIRAGPLGTFARAFGAGPERGDSFVLAHTRTRATAAAFCNENGLALLRQKFS